VWRLLVAGKKNERRDLTKKLISVYEGLRPELLDITREILLVRCKTKWDVDQSRLFRYSWSRIQLSQSSKVDERENLMGAIWLAFVQVHDAAISQVCVWHLPLAISLGGNFTLLPTHTHTHD
jgi:hypothetical protein